MNFELSSEHKLIFESTLGFAREHFAPLVEKMEKEDEWPEEIWAMAARQGLLGAWVPEEYGGSGGDFTSAVMILQAIFRVSSAIGLSVGAHLNLCVHNIMRNGTEEQKMKYLPKLVKGEWVGAMGLTEPDHGSDAMGIQTKAVRKGDHYVLNGSKIFITNGPIADVIVVYARTKQDAGSRGLSAFIVETTTPGFNVSKKLKKTGHLGSPTGELFFEDMVVPAENLLGEENNGFRIIMKGLDIERAVLTCAGVALIEESLELSLKYAQERKQFGQPIAGFQLIQAKLADMYTSLTNSRLALYNVCSLIEQGKRASLESAAACLYSAESAVRAADESVQIHGGYGYIKDFPVERIWRDSKLLEIGGGTKEIRRILIAAELLGLR
ncbi:MAG: acyl-CoA dehydrogenase family protein [Geobacteraceae bacterium]